jgi:hypothetical protein
MYPMIEGRRRADVNLLGNLYKLWNRPGDVLPIVPKETKDSTTTLSRRQTKPGLTVTSHFGRRIS